MMRMSVVIVRRNFTKDAVNAKTEKILAKSMVKYTQTTMYTVRGVMQASNQMG